MLPQAAAPLISPAAITSFGTPADAVALYAEAAKAIAVPPHCLQVGPSEADGRVAAGKSEKFMGADFETLSQLFRCCSCLVASHRACLCC